MGGGGSKPAEDPESLRRPAAPAAAPAPQPAPVAPAAPVAPVPTLTGRAEQVDAPIPLTTQEDRVEPIVTLDEVIGPEGSTAKYIRKKTIGQGAYGEAAIVMRNPAYNPAHHPVLETQLSGLSRPTIPGALYVAKISDLRQFQQNSRQCAQTEVICLGHSCHFAIIKYYEHFILESGNDQMVLITELANHGDLHHNLQSTVSLDGKTTQALRLTEREAGIFFVQILCALNHVHRRRMIHRDVKSANLFLTSNGIIKLGDFGFSQKYESTVSSESVAATFLGTPHYLSPEMWKGMRYGKRADVWAAGVVLYEMLMDGQRPFGGDGANLTYNDLRTKVLEEEVVLPGCPPQVPGMNRGYFTTEMRELLMSMFNRNPKERPGTEELLATPIMQHYLYIFEKHVHQLIQADDALMAQSGGRADVRARLNFPDPDDRALVLTGLEEAKNIVADTRKDTQGPVTFEGVVFKDSQNGVWKERYLTLTEEALVISLCKGKAAATGSERRKAVPVESIISSTPCTIQAPYPPDPNNFIPPFAFAIAMKSMHTIIFGLRTAEERDQWLTAIMKVLQID